MLQRIFQDKISLWNQTFLVSFLGLILDVDILLILSFGLANQDSPSILKNVLSLVLQIFLH